jgi:protein-tyrosine-phosphatase
MAEAILRHELGSTVQVHSAGPAPSQVHPLALEALHNMGVGVEGLRSKGLEEVQHIGFDVVITLCDKAKEACAPDRSWARQIHWSLADPAAVSGSHFRRRRAFEDIASEIAIRLRHLVPLLKRHEEG